MPNIVQAEFFHVGGKNTSLGGLFKECGERVAEDLPLILQGVEPRSQIKTVVRFFDRDGSITAFARRFEQTEQRFDALLSASGWRRRWLNFRSRRWAGNILALKEQAANLAAQELEASIQASDQVAVECLDNSFRPARKDELHELCEAARRATGVWLFVFEPNDLLADKNESVARVM